MARATTSLVAMRASSTDHWNANLLRNPYKHFLLSEVWGGLSAGAVLLLGWMLAFTLQYVRFKLPLEHPEPLIFAENTLTWITVFSSILTFLVTTVYQTFVLISALRRSFQNG